MSKKIIVANWKENPLSIREAVELSSGLSKTASVFKKIKLIVCPPEIFVSKLISKKNLIFGLQDISAEKEGSFTGETSAFMAKSIGVEYVILGHSERRRMGDTNEIVKRKLVLSLEAGLSPIVCVGENSRDKDGGFLLELENQIKEIFSGIDKKSFKKIVIAYEPIWAVGKSEGTALRGREIHEATLFLRKVLATLIGKKEAMEMPILYGGSVFPINASEIISDSECQGLLVGRQSLDSKALKEIIRVVDSIK